MAEKAISLPLPVPLKETNGFEEFHGDTFCVQAIDKINTKGIRERRTMLVTSTFLLQVDKRKVVTRMLPLDEIIAMQYSAHADPRVLVKANEQAEYFRDWYFRLAPSFVNTHGTLAEVFYVINQCRQDVAPRNSALLQLTTPITLRVRDRKTSKTKTPPQISAMYRENPASLPSPRRDSSGSVAHTERALPRHRVTFILPPVDGDKEGYSRYLVLKREQGLRQKAGNNEAIQRHDIEIACDTALAMACAEPEFLSRREVRVRCKIEDNQRRCWRRLQDQHNDGINAFFTQPATPASCATAPVPAPASTSSAATASNTTGMAVSVACGRPEASDLAAFHHMPPLSLCSDHPGFSPSGRYPEPRTPLSPITPASFIKRVDSASSVPTHRQFSPRSLSPVANKPAGPSFASIQLIPQTPGRTPSCSSMPAPNRRSLPEGMLARLDERDDEMAELEALGSAGGLKRRKKTPHAAWLQVRCQSDVGQLRDDGRRHTPGGGPRKRGYSASFASDRGSRLGVPVMERNVSLRCIQRVESVNVNTPVADDSIPSGTYHTAASHDLGPTRKGVAGSGNSSASLPTATTFASACEPSERAAAKGEDGASKKEEGGAEKEEEEEEEEEEDDGDEEEECRPYPSTAYCLSAPDRHNPRSGGGLRSESAGSSPLCTPSPSTLLCYHSGNLSVRNSGGTAAAVPPAKLHRTLSNVASHAAPETTTVLKSPTGPSPQIHPVNLAHSAEPWGIHCVPLDPPARGVSMVSVLPGSPFNRAGLTAGRLLEVNGIPLATPKDVETAAEHVKAAGHARFLVLVAKEASSQTSGGRTASVTNALYTSVGSSMQSSTMSSPGHVSDSLPTASEFFRPAHAKTAFMKRPLSLSSITAPLPPELLKKMPDPGFSTPAEEPASSSQPSDDRAPQRNGRVLRLEEGKPWEEELQEVLPHPESPKAFVCKPPQLLLPDDGQVRGNEGEESRIPKGSPQTAQRGPNWSPKPGFNKPPQLLLPDDAGQTSECTPREGEGRIRDAGSPATFVVKPPQLVSLDQAQQHSTEQMNRGGDEGPPNDHASDGCEGEVSTVPSPGVVANGKSQPDVGPHAAGDRGEAPEEEDADRREQTRPPAEGEPARASAGGSNDEAAPAEGQLAEGAAAAAAKAPGVSPTARGRKRPQQLLLPGAAAAAAASPQPAGGPRSPGGAPGGRGTAERAESLSDDHTARVRLPASEAGEEAGQPGESNSPREEASQPTEPAGERSDSPVAAPRVGKPTSSCEGGDRAAIEGSGTAHGDASPNESGAGCPQPVEERESLDPPFDDRRGAEPVHSERSENNGSCRSTADGPASPKDDRPERDAAAPALKTGDEGGSDRSAGAPRGLAGQPGAGPVVERQTESSGSPEELVVGPASKRADEAGKEEAEASASRVSKPAAEAEEEEGEPPSGRVSKPAAEAEEEEGEPPSGRVSKPAAEAEEEEGEPPSGRVSKPAAEAEEEEGEPPSGRVSKPAAEAEEEEGEPPSGRVSKPAAEAEEEEGEPPSGRVSKPAAEAEEEGEPPSGRVSKRAENAEKAEEAPPACIASKRAVGVAEKDAEGEEEEDPGRPKPSTRRPPQLLLPDAAAAPVEAPLFEGKEDADLQPQPQTSAGRPPCSPREPSPTASHTPGSSPAGPRPAPKCPRPPSLLQLETAAPADPLTAKQPRCAKRRQSGDFAKKFVQPLRPVSDDDDDPPAMVDIRVSKEPEEGGPERKEEGPREGVQFVIPRLSLPGHVALATPPTSTRSRLDFGGQLSNVSSFGLRTETSTDLALSPFDQEFLGASLHPHAGLTGARQSWCGLTPRTWASELSTLDLTFSSPRTRVFTPEPGSPAPLDAMPTPDDHHKHPLHAPALSQHATPARFDLDADNKPHPSSLGTEILGLMRAHLDAQRHPPQRPQRIQPDEPAQSVPLSYTAETGRQPQSGATQRVDQEEEGGVGHTRAQPLADLADPLGLPAGVDAARCSPRPGAVALAARADECKAGGGAAPPRDPLSRAGTRSTLFGTARADSGRLSRVTTAGSSLFATAKTASSAAERPPSVRFVPSPGEATLSPEARSLFGTAKPRRPPDGPALPTPGAFNAADIGAFSALGRSGSPAVSPHSGRRGSPVGSLLGVFNAPDISAVSVLGRSASPVLSPHSGRRGSPVGGLLGVFNTADIGAVSASPVVSPHSGRRGSPVGGLLGAFKPRNAAEDGAVSPLVCSGSPRLQSPNSGRRGSPVGSLQGAFKPRSAAEDSAASALASSGFPRLRTPDSGRRGSPAGSLLGAFTVADIGAVSALGRSGSPLLSPHSGRRGSPAGSLLGGSKAHNAAEDSTVSPLASSGSPHLRSPDSGRRGSPVGGLLGVSNPYNTTGDRPAHSPRAEIAVGSAAPNTGAPALDATPAGAASGAAGRQRFADAGSSADRVLSLRSPDSGANFRLPASGSLLDLPLSCPSGAEQQRFGNAESSADCTVLRSPDSGTNFGLPAASSQHDLTLSSPPARFANAGSFADRNLLGSPDSGTKNRLPAASSLLDLTFLSPPARFANAGSFADRTLLGSPDSGTNFGLPAASSQLDPAPSPPPGAGRRSFASAGSYADRTLLGSPRSGAHAGLPAASSLLGTAKQRFLAEASTISALARSGSPSFLGSPRSGRWGSPVGSLLGAFKSRNAAEDSTISAIASSGSPLSRPPDSGRRESPVGGLQGAFKPRNAAEDSTVLALASSGSPLLRSPDSGRRGSPVGGLQGAFKPRNAAEDSTTSALASSGSPLLRSPESGRRGSPAGSLLGAFKPRNAAEDGAVSPLASSGSPLLRSPLSARRGSPVGSLLGAFKPRDAAENSAASALARSRSPLLGSPGSGRRGSPAGILLGASQPCNAAEDSAISVLAISGSPVSGPRISPAACALGGAAKPRAALGASTPAPRPRSPGDQTFLGSPVSAKFGTSKDMLGFTSSSCLEKSTASEPLQRDSDRSLQEELDAVLLDLESSKARAKRAGEQAPAGRRKSVWDAAGPEAVPVAKAPPSLLESTMRRCPNAGALLASTLSSPTAPPAGGGPLSATHPAAHHSRQHHQALPHFGPAALPVKPARPLLRCDYHPSPPSGKKPSL
ncbi:hypothetical protein DIPPA_29876 [Diplonema papillatum]|nr:hypothetical protein DIPPA_29876 [Diplonema papillatum]